MTVPSSFGHTRAKARTLFAAAAVATTAVALAVPAAASAATTHTSPDGGAGPAVFVQTDNTAGNQVAAYARASDGTLTLAGTYPTGGLGGQLTGSVVDHLASQGSLQYDAAQHLLIAVNAGSNSLTVCSGCTAPGCTGGRSSARAASSRSASPFTETWCTR